MKCTCDCSCDSCYDSDTLRAQLDVAHDRVKALEASEASLTRLAQENNNRIAMLEAALMGLLSVPVVGAEDDDGLLIAHMKVRGHAAALLNGEPSAFDSMPRAGLTKEGT